MEVAQGRISDRPFGRTVYNIAAQRFTGDLLVREGDKRYKLSWEDGSVVAAESAAPADSAGRVALSAGLVTSTDVTRTLDAVARSPGTDPLAVLTDLARLKPDQVAGLKRRLLAQRAARVFALTEAAYVLDNARSMRADPDVPPLDARWLVFFGVRTHFTIERLERELGALLDRGFKLADDALGVLPSFAFGDVERPVMERLAMRPWTPRQLIAACAGMESRVVLSIMYALVACDCLEPGVAPDTIPPPPPPAGIARGTEQRPPTTAAEVEDPARRRASSSAPAVPGAGEHSRLAHGTVRRLLFPGQGTVAPPVAAGEGSGPVRARRTTSNPPVTEPPPEEPSSSSSSSRIRTPTPTPPPTRSRPSSVPPPARGRITPSGQIRSRPSTPPPRSGSASTPPPTRPHSTTIPPILRRLHHTTVPPDGSKAAAAEIRRMVQDKVKAMDRGADHYTMLGVSQGATSDEIRAAYFGIAKRIHPDRLLAVGVTDISSDAQRLFARINQAFGVLSDPARRAEYGLMLAAGGEEVVRKAQADAEDKAGKVLRAEETFRLGEMALRRSQFDQARVLFEEAVSLNPEEAEYHALLGWAIWLSSANKQVVAPDVQKRFAQALALSPQCVPAHFYGGQVAKHSGQIQAAIEAFRTVIDLEPEHVEAALELRLLRGRLRRK